MAVLSAHRQSRRETELELNQLIVTRIITIHENGAERDVYKDEEMHCFMMCHTSHSTIMFQLHSLSWILLDWGLEGWRESVLVHHSFFVSKITKVTSPPF